MRIGVTEEWVRFRAKCGNWHAIPEDAVMRTCQLTRRRDGMRWCYSVSIVVDGVAKKRALQGAGIVALDWGHREHGHDNAKQGIRAFTWVGDDGRSGEILLPAECRRLLDEVDEIKSRIDQAFDARKEARNLTERNRHTYRRRLTSLGVLSEEESLWLKWEMRYERRLNQRRKRIQNLRRETYLAAARELRQHYAVFAIEDQVAESMKQLDLDEMTRHRKRSNRDMTARYEFTQICERLGAHLVPVTARNTTRECPDCGELAEVGPELLIVCPGCGGVRDRDFGACVVILKRAQAALAERDAAE
jgi:transposase